MLCEFILTPNFSELMRHPYSLFQDPLFPHRVLLLISFRGTTPPLSEFLRIDWISRDLRVGRDGCAGILLFPDNVLLFPASIFSSTTTTTTTISAILSLSYLISYLISVSTALCTALCVLSDTLFFTALSYLYCICHCYSLPVLLSASSRFPLSLSLKTTLHFSVNPLYYLVSVA